jgi:hypothetical protein
VRRKGFLVGEKTVLFEPSTCACVGILLRDEAMRVLLLLSCFGLAAACHRPCPVEVPQTSADGGAATCVTSADCLRPPSTLVCASTEDHLRDCIDCVDRRCVRYVPEACP